MPRPRRPATVRVKVTLSLDPEVDADLVQFFRACAPRQRATCTKARLRAGRPLAAQAEEPSDADLADLLLMLE